MKKDDCEDLKCENEYCINRSQEICMLHHDPKMIKNCVAKIKHDALGSLLRLIKNQSEENAERLDVLVDEISLVKEEEK